MKVIEATYMGAYVRVGICEPCYAEKPIKEYWHRVFPSKRPVDASKVDWHYVSGVAPNCVVCRKQFAC